MKVKFVNIVIYVFIIMLSLLPLISSQETIAVKYVAIIFSVLSTTVAIIVQKFILAALLKFFDLFRKEFSSYYTLWIFCYMLLNTVIIIIIEDTPLKGVVYINPVLILFLFVGWKFLRIQNFETKKALTFLCTFYIINVFGSILTLGMNI